MSEKEFWALIEDARRSSGCESFLEQRLAALALEGRVAFENAFRRMLGMACTMPLVSANFVLLSYTSDDVFENFCAWLILHGRIRFEEAVRNPETIAGWLARADATDCQAG